MTSEKMTLERMVEIWLSPYGDDPLPDYSKLFPYYHPNCRFHDSIQSVEGLDKFKEVCKKLEKRCKEIRIELHDQAQNGNKFFFEWTMTMKFGPTPLTPLHGASKLIVDDDGLITLHRDYYDLWGDSIDMIPGINKVYRWFMKTFMG